MSKHFTRTFRVRWSETNAMGEVDITGYLRYLMETAWDWGASNGLSIAESEAIGLAWAIRETEINFYRPLYPNDIFDFNIWLVNWRRVRGTRCFELRIHDGGDLVAQGVQKIVTLDGKTMRPAPPPEGLIANFQIDNPRIFPLRQFPKYNPLSETAFFKQREVEWGDLDSFEHVNNATYATFAENVIMQALTAASWTPSQFKTQGFYILNRRFHIQYLTPALWGDRLNVAIYLVKLYPTGGSWYIAVEHASNGEPITECIVEWVLVNRSNGEEQNLPDRLFRALKKMVAVVNKDI